MRASLETAVEARIACEKNLAEARNAVEAAAGALRELEEAKLQAEARAAPLRERMGELRLKEQAAQINFDQFATQLAEAGADEELLAHAKPASAPRASSLQGEITRLTQAINELGAVNLAALEELQHQPGAQDLPRLAVRRPGGGGDTRSRTRSAASTARPASCCARPSTR